ncbi:hypothetical protein WR25_11390 [Diploscapter pachys]|uniref:H15 domain-containing protein n=1 Tax=Diploscapter pachys TaxID=2018661 RepID=A0A2A2L397_9BILA|nr:hypothetical protein WR25_11390 [Diploscapter pachys]
MTTVAKSPAKKATTTKKVASHPTYGSMIRKAITELKERGGSSRPAILKYLQTHYNLGTNMPQIKSHFRRSLKRGVTKGELKIVGASFKLTEKAQAKKVAKRVKKATKPKKTTTTTKKTAAKPKSPAKKLNKKPKSPTKKPKAKTTKAVAKPKAVKA